jgi:hypothetical protein
LDDSTLLPEPLDTLYQLGSREDAEPQHRVQPSQCQVAMLQSAEVPGGANGGGDSETVDLSEFVRQDSAFTAGDEAITQSAPVAGAEERDRRYGQMLVRREDHVSAVEPARAAICDEAIWWHDQPQALGSRANRVASSCREVDAANHSSNQTRTAPIHELDLADPGRARGCDRERFMAGEWEPGPQSRYVEDSHAVVMPGTTGAAPRKSSAVDNRAREDF